MTTVTHKYNVCQNAEFLTIIADSTYSYYTTLKGYGTKLRGVSIAVGSQDSVSVIMPLGVARIQEF